MAYEARIGTPLLAPIVGKMSIALHATTSGHYIIFLYQEYMIEDNIVQLH